MTRFIFGVSAVLFLPFNTVFASPPATPAPSAAVLPPPPLGVTDLHFTDFFTGSERGLVPTPTLRACDGKHIRLVGFMARIEADLKGAFVLCPRPTAGDEEGGGTADLPPQSVRVIVRGAKGKVIPFTPRSLAVTGVLHVEPQTDENGHVWGLNLVMDRLSDLPRATIAGTPSTKKPVSSRAQGAAK